MLKLSTVHSLAPVSEGRFLKPRSHDFDDFGFAHVKLFLDSIKGGTVFPSHLYNTVDTDKKILTTKVLVVRILSIHFLQQKNAIVAACSAFTNL